MLARMEATFDASAQRPHALDELARAAAARPFDRRIVIGPRRGVVREILQRLAREGVGWIGFEATTPLALARDLVTARIIEMGFTPVDEFGELELIDEAIARALEAPGGAVLEAFVGGAGLRAAMAGSIQALRLGGIEPPVLGRAGFRDRLKREALERVLIEYERLLRARRMIDAAGLIRHAAEQLAAHTLTLPAAKYFILPGQDRRGVAGALLRVLIGFGARVLRDESVLGVEQPSSLFGVQPISTTEDTEGTETERQNATDPHRPPPPAIPTRIRDDQGRDSIHSRDREMDFSVVTDNGTDSSVATDNGTDSGVADGTAGARRVSHRPATALAYLHQVDQLPADMPVHLEMFAAGSVSDEVREVLRRVVSRGWRWDEVEVVAVDAVAYGTAVDSLARRLGIPVTYAAGLPVSRTRPGRAVDAYLRWIREDFAEDVLRDAIERGDIAPPDGGHGTPGPELARRLRRLTIGRGRDRYLPALDRARKEAPVADLDEGASAEEELEARTRSQHAIDDLRDIIATLLDATPTLPDRIDFTEPGVSPAALARGLLAFLSLVPVSPQTARSDGMDGAASVDALTKARLSERLQRFASVALRPTTLDAAVSIVAAKLDTRVPAPGSAGASPWSSAGGHLHISDLEHGGHTGRRVTFVVGLDASRFPGGVPHDTLLGDEERRRLLADAPFAPIPTSAERLHERRWHLARMLARLRGTVTLSYSAWEAAEARTVAPAAEMLQAFRLLTRNPTADYEKMHDDLPLATSVPSATGCLDRSDVWLQALAGKGVMLRGTEVVRAAFAELDAGLSAAEMRGANPFNPHHGRITPRDGLDPRDHPELVVSAKRLETLGACPLRYLIRYVLGVQPPEDHEWVGDRWLTPLERGRLLHDVFHRTLRDFGSDRDVNDPSFEDIAVDRLAAVVHEWSKTRPPPGEAVREVELASLREDVLAFVQMTRQLGAPWRRLELNFGRGTRSASDPVRIELVKGAIRVAGAIDRIDEADEGFVVIDYKTGSADRFGRSRGVFDGGRRLQHALYAAVTRRLEGNVARAEYHFPTHRGEARVQAFEERELRKARKIIDALLDGVAAGAFHPTSDPDDCRFCDYRAACRVRDTNRGIDSPLARWAAGTDAGELTIMRALRRKRPL
ncbi:MAG: PD-(D/E)XK nuclease family protein [Gemmatimonadetes bacterium]|nr:PD-(D/E)XK nuclease family protein [Gemmatimonadota bacterium]